MPILNIIFLVALVTAGSCLIVFQKRTQHLLTQILSFIILLACIQFVVEGYYWQFIPGYLLLILLIFTALFLRRLGGRLPQFLIKCSLVLLIIVSVVPWTIFIPIPTLHKPQGPHIVGTRIFRWVDTDRPEHLTSAKDDSRNVIVQAWYPTQQTGESISSDYLDGLGKLPPKIGFLPSRIFDHYSQINTHGIPDAPISKLENHWPVVIFLTGNSASRAFYSSLVAGLASQGYVVLVIDHPYEAMITQLANGELVTEIEPHRDGEPDLMKFMKRRLDLRVRDVKFILDKIDEGATAADDFLSFLDKNRIVIAGHSLGGASAAVAMAADTRIKAAANIDGTLYGELPGSKVSKPFLLLESNKGDSERYQRYESGNKRLFEHFGGGFRYEIPEADHYSFTDAPLLLAFPARFIASRFFAFGNIPAKTHSATVEVLDVFFRDALSGKSPDLNRVVKRYQGIIPKTVE